MARRLINICEARGRNDATQLVPSVAFGFTKLIFSRANKTI